MYKVNIIVNITMNVLTLLFSSDLNIDSLFFTNFIAMPILYSLPVVSLINTVLTNV